KTAGGIFPGAGRLAHLAAEDMRQLAKEERQYVFHSQGTIIAKNALKILADQKVKFNKNSHFVFLGPAVDKKDVIKIAKKLGVIEEQITFYANPRDPISNVLSDARTGTVMQGIKDLLHNNFEDHKLDNYKWWREWRPNEKHY
ncbi:MAG: hypothetical protein ABH857_03700, partial [Elusimicrobiota bacterium]